MKTLVVLYSRTGHTREVGHRIAAALGADMEELGDRINRLGILGYLRSGRDAWLQRRADLRPLSHDPAAYDLVVVGTPVWSGSLSPPVRAFLHDQQRALRDVAFFCTRGGRGSERTFEQMAEACGHSPVSSLALTERDLKGPGLPAAIQRFVLRVATQRHAA